MIPAGEWTDLERAFEAAVGDCLPAVACKYKLDEHTVLGLWGELMASLAPAMYGDPVPAAEDLVALGQRPRHDAAV